MFDVSDFNAVRISLASPEQIRSWSYGEITKPETINYRTLKPEKDGLFCEKIFGPTKDFECYCGKYKRVRYKGIICDKCGVEVARSKVRRERMGHLELATPASHIWFVKGTPSRMGLLLDLSPRSLEKVLYFAQFIVTSVDEKARQRALDVLREDMDRDAIKREKPAQDAIDELGATRDAAVAEFEAKRAEELAKVEEGLQSGVDALMAKPSDVKEAQTAVKALEEAAAQRRSDIQLLADAGNEAANHEFEAASAPQREEVRLAREAIHAEYTANIEKLEDLKPLQLLMDTQYRELEEKFGHVFKAGMGAEAVLGILNGIDLEQLREQLSVEIYSSSGQRRKKATKRLRVVEAFRKSGNHPSWMVFTVLPVLPPDLRPMVQLDGGRFATSDLNDLYRRVINRNNRLKRLLDLGAPEIIIRNEKRMLQEAVDSLIDNGRRGRAVAGQGNHKLKSLSDMLKGKQGRFRQNLLGKRVDYSGRSVIVVGPELKLQQCGLPKRMALELFKPFVMHALVAKGLAHNIKSAKRIVERARPEVWDVLDEVIKDRPVMLNRAPTLHRLGIQAFEPTLIEGSAIQLHPLVCAAFNADFDGDQMAVHVPLSREAVAEARQHMLATHNLLLPSSGEPTVAPTLDMVLGCYYLTSMKPGARGEYRPANGRPAEGVFGSFLEAQLAESLGVIDLQARILVRDERTGGRLIETTVGRTIFNEILPDVLGYKNEVMDKKTLKSLVAECYKVEGEASTGEMVDAIKNIGFRYATRSGVSIAMNDIKVPEAKEELLESAEARVTQITDQYLTGLMTEQERYDQSIEVWTETTNLIQKAIADTLDRYGSVYMMANSGAKGNIAQIRQMAGMRGLMSDPSGRIIALPIRSSFREGLPVLEYFISTHGARKGLADTALRTADSGYLTRRLIDVAQDVIILLEECETLNGVWLSEARARGIEKTLGERIIGRHAAQPVAHPGTGEVLAERNQEIDEVTASAITEARIERVFVRSPLTCDARRGLCRFCYGRDLARGTLVKIGEAVGIISAQSIGEPGTQLTMRTFHTGGVAGLDITSGLPRVEELFEARIPKGQAVITEIEGVVESLSDTDTRSVRVTRTDTFRDEYELPDGYALAVKSGKKIEAGTVLAEPNAAKPKRGKAKDEEPEQTKVVAAPIVARVSGQVVEEAGKRIAILYEENDVREYPIPAASRVQVDTGDFVVAGQPLTEGYVNPQDILRVKGRDAVQQYLVEEVQRVYELQGVNINDKHIEVIARQMLRKVRIDAPGDATMLPGELVDRFAYEEINAKVLAEGGEPATADTVLLGVTKASLNTESFLAAASFMETTRVLTEASVSGAVDRLLGLKENVIIGKLIPARAEIDLPPRLLLRPRPLFALGVEGEESLDELMTTADGLDFDLDLEADLAEGDMSIADLEEEELVAVEAPPRSTSYIAVPDDGEDDRPSFREQFGAE